MGTVSIETLAAMAGQNIGVSDWIMVDQARINAFADVTEDHQFIHVDQDRAAQTPLGGTVAHGFLTLSLLSAMMGSCGFPQIDGARMMLNYGTDKVRFLNPVKAGKRVRGHVTLQDVVEKRAGEWLYRLNVSVEIEGEEKPALVAQWLGAVML